MSFRRSRFPAQENSGCSECFFPGFDSPGVCQRALLLAVELLCLQLRWAARELLELQLERCCLQLDCVNFVTYKYRKPARARVFRTHQQFLISGSV